MKKIILISILLISGLVTNAQCNDELVERAKSRMTNDEVLLKEFKIELKEADISSPAPVAKFSQKFEKNKKYRLRIISDKEKYNAEGIIKIFEGNRYLGTNHDVSSGKTYPYCDFKCSGSGDYKLLITFKDGKAGCAVVVVSYLGVWSKQ
ncbi:MAG: hypothetical protein GQ564_01285 [Bacteroidales bacterium]|nr:hypothetical protein [Bacteroidales bacterium]